MTHAEIDALWRELKALRARVDELERMADRDSVLPLLNRRAFMRELEAHFAAAAPGSLLFLDLDHLKKVNDTYGHAAGDALLAHFARLLASHVGDGASVGRLGGDEFAILTRGASRHQAGESAEGLGVLVRASPMIWNGQTVPVSFCFGVCDLGCARDAQDAIRQADGAMYAQKRAARRAAE